MDGINQHRDRILVVDDEPAIRLLISNTLGREGFRVTEAETGRRALAIFADHQYDLILLDVMMPDLDGFATCAQLRQMPGGAHVPIMMITGLNDRDSIQRAYGAGATDFITKPLSPLILVHRVRYVLRAKAAMLELAWRVDFQRVLIETIPVPVLVQDAQGRCLVSNPAFESLTGQSLDQLNEALADTSNYRGLKPRSRVEHGDGQLRQQAYETELPGADSTARAVIVHQAAFTPPDSGESGIISVILDISERKKHEEHLRLADTVFRTASDAIMVTDATGIIKLINPAFTTITGYHPEEAIGQTPRLLKSGRQEQAFYADLWQNLRETGRWSGELWQRRKNGEVYPVWETIAALRDRDQHIVEYVAFFNDITARKRVEQEIFHRANYDLLTGLPNRGLLHERLEQAIRQARRHDRYVVLMFMDLDRFKQVNDTLGHSFGDLLLYQTAKRLLLCVRDTDTVARQGGDEFVMVLSDVADTQDAGLVAQKVISQLAEPFDLGGNIVRIGVSIGVALYPHHAGEAEELLRQADLAMFQAKMAGRNTWRLYEPAMTDKLTEQLSLETDLRCALERDQLAICYQPIVEIVSGRLVGAEALLRWQHPHRGLVSPAEFIPLAEETGLIREMGAWVLEQVCLTQVGWRQQGLKVPISVNLSGVQIFRGLSVEALATLLQQHQLEATSLILEVTEGALLVDMPQARQWLEGIQKLGIRLDLDDFGTGYSSLSCLKQFPISRLKIDISFIRDLMMDAGDRTLVEAILAIGHSLHLGVVAEGVETAEQLAVLRALGCDYAQGYYFSPPVTHGEFFGIAQRLGTMDA